MRGIQRAFYLSFFVRKGGEEWPLFTNGHILPSALGGKVGQLGVKANILGRGSAKGRQGGGGGGGEGDGI